MQTCRECGTETRIVTPCCGRHLCKRCSSRAHPDQCRCGILRNSYSLSICKQKRIPITVIAKVSYFSYLYSGVLIGLTNNRIKLDYKKNNKSYRVLIKYENIIQWKPKNAPDNFTCGEINEQWVEWYMTKKQMNLQRTAESEDINLIEPQCGVLLDLYLNYDVIDEMQR